MKVVKLTKRMLNSLPEILLEKLGAANFEINRGFPNHVYISKEDYKTFKKNFKNRLKHYNPNRANKEIEMAVATGMLTYGPNQILENVIRPGYALVDEEKIKVEIVTAKLTG